MNQPPHGQQPPYHPPHGQHPQAPQQQGYAPPQQGYTPPQYGYGQPQQGYGQPPGYPPPGPGNPYGGPPQYGVPHGGPVRRGTNKVAIWAISIGAVLFGTCMVVGIAADDGEDYDFSSGSYADSGKSSADPSDYAAFDQSWVFSIDDLHTAVGGFEPQTGLGSVEESSLLGSQEFSYEYDTGAEDGGVYLSCDVTREPSSSDAGATYLGGKIGMGLLSGLLGEDVRIEERNDLVRWGDESEFRLFVSKDAGPIGGAMMARRGNDVFMLIMSGAPLASEENTKTAFEAATAKWDSKAL